MTGATYKSLAKNQKIEGNTKDMCQLSDEESERLRVEFTSTIRDYKLDVFDSGFTTRIFSSITYLKALGLKEEEIDGDKVLRMINLIDTIGRDYLEFFMLDIQK